MLKLSMTFIRFILVGIINTLLSLAIIFCLLNIFSTGYWYATFFGNSAGAIVSYFLNRNFTFKNQSDYRKTVIKFFLVILLCYYISYALGKYTANLFHVFLSNEATVKNIAVLISAGFYTTLNYFMQKYLVFRK